MKNEKLEITIPGFHYSLLTTHSVGLAFFRAMLHALCTMFYHSRFTIHDSRSFSDSLFTIHDSRSFSDSLFTIHYSRFSPPGVIL
jgi:hypothetical protein